MFDDRTDTIVFTGRQHDLRLCL